ncbi:hypothetical protein A3Q56_05569, partial [Intoshia linei]
MVSNFKFNDCNKKRKVIKYLEGNSECNMDRHEKFRLKKKSVYFFVKNGELFFLKDNSKLKILCYDKLNLKRECILSLHKIGHCGVKKTKQLNDNLFYNIKENDIATLIAECPQCQKSYGFTTVTKIRPIVTIHIRERY